MNYLEVFSLFLLFITELKGSEGAQRLRVQYARRTIVEAKQHSSVIECYKKLISRAPPCFERHVKSLVPAVFAVVSTHQSALGPRGGLCHSSGGINRLMMNNNRTAETARDNKFLVTHPLTAHVA
jgi:membrane-bound lytic murein transglycosylase MltF